MSKEILIIKHVEIEGPDTIEEFFKNTSWNIRIIDLSKGDSLNRDFKDIAAVISLGGPMNVYEEKKYPFLKDEDEFLKKALKEKIPILGICLGAQLLAKACGAKVKKAPKEEIGWYKINLTDKGKKDTLFRGLDFQLDVFQWHEDMFEIPKDALHLAESQGSPNQAFKFGENAYGLQFHIEVTPKMIESWVNEYKESQERFNAKDMLIEAYKRRESFRKQADTIYFNFAKIISNRQ